MLHPEFVVREGPTSPVTFQLLSGDGNFNVVRATGHSKMVPRAGLWRVDRRDGSRVRLPDGDQASRISRDGSRVLITTGDPSTGGTAVLWSPAPCSRRRPAVSSPRTSASVSSSIPTAP